VNLVDKFVKKLTGNSKSNPVLRLKTLSTIYNVLGGNGTARYTLHPKSSTLDPKP
jgi:hypothetical protein